MQTNRSGARRGFSLLELLVAALLAMVLVVLAFALLARGGEGLAGARCALQQDGGARAALGFMAGEMSSRLPGSPLEEVGDDADWPCARIGFFRVVAAGEPAGVGDVVYVRYAVASVAGGDGRVSRHLQRSWWSGSAAVAALKQGKGPDVPPDACETLLAGVVGFDVRRSGPAAAELTLAIASLATAQRLATTADWRAQTPVGLRWLGSGRAAAGQGVEIYQTGAWLNE